MTRSRIADALLAAAFALGASAPGLGWITGVGRPVGALELRPLNPPPDWPPDGAESFARACDRWIGDHFGGREALTRAHHAVSFFLLGDTPSADVIRGRDGWLFLATANAAAMHCRTLPPLTEPTLRAWRRVLAERTAYLGDRGVRHVFVIPPQKETIYPEHWPAELAVTAGTDRFDQLCDDLATRPETGFVDLRQPLRSARDAGKVYFAHDVHWTDLGASAACDAIARALGWEPLGARRLAMARVDTRGGDLARLCGVDRWLVESAPELRADPPFAAALAAPPHRAGPWDTRWIRADAPHRPRAVALGDSFLYRMQHPLAEQCAEIAFHACAEFDVDLIEAARPDVVLVEMVELTAVQTVPLNPVAVRAIPDEDTLAHLSTGLLPGGAFRFGTLALIGAHIDDRHGELVLAWRSLAPTDLTGRLYVELLGSDGTVSFAHPYPQDPLGSAVATDRAWLDHVPLPGDPAAVHAVRLRLDDHADRPTAVDGSDRTTVTIRRNR